MIFSACYFHVSSLPFQTYHVQADNFAFCLLDFLQLRKEVPEAGFCDHIVRSKDAHAIEFRGRVGLGGQVTPDDLVF